MRLLATMIISGVCAALVAGGSVVLAQGRRDDVSPRGGPAVERSPEGLPGQLRREEMQRDAAEERARERAQEMERAREEAERAREMERAQEQEGARERATERRDVPSAARERMSPEEREALREEQEPGFFGRVRRFFGFGRSQERMSEEGREHERATEQDRGPED